MNENVVIDHCSLTKMKMKMKMKMETNEQVLEQCQRTNQRILSVLLSSSLVFVHLLVVVFVVVAADMSIYAYGVQSLSPTSAKVSSTLLYQSIVQSQPPLGVVAAFVCPRGQQKKMMWMVWMVWMVLAARR